MKAKKDIYGEMYRRVAFCLAHALWKTGWTVQELADASGLEFGLVRDVLLGKKDVTLLDIAKMESALGYEILRISFEPHQGALQRRDLGIDPEGEEIGATPDGTVDGRVEPEGEE